MTDEVAPEQSEAGHGASRGPAAIKEAATLKFRLQKSRREQDTKKRREA